MSYCLAGQVINFSNPVPEIEPYLITGTEGNLSVPVIVPPAQALICRTTGWVGEADRQVKIWSASYGMIVKVEGEASFYIAPGGGSIVRGDGVAEMTALDREILLGPALVLALALREVWCLHASAAMYKEKVIVFLGESGQGKSTLATYLAGAGWQLVSDDILPLTGDPSGVQSWPHFPQLKLPPESQPGLHLPEQLPLGKICLLFPSGKDDTPAVQLLPSGEAVKVLLAHTAGARLFGSYLLSRHLEFCARSAEQVPAYRLAYHHRRDVLPLIKRILEGLC